MTKKETLWEPCPLHWLNTLDIFGQLLHRSTCCAFFNSQLGSQVSAGLVRPQHNRDNLDLKSLVSTVDFTNVRGRLDEARHCPMASHGNPQHPTAPEESFSAEEGGHEDMDEELLQTDSSPHLRNVHQIKLRDWLIWVLEWNGLENDLEPSNVG